MLDDTHQLDTAQYAQQPIETAAPARVGLIAKIEAHPFISAIAMAAFLIFIGIFVVSRRAAVDPAAGGQAWGGANITVLNPTSYGRQQAALQQPDSIMQQVQSAPSYTYTPLPTGSSDSYSEAPSGAPASGNDFNFDAFVQMLSHNSSTGTPASDGSNVNDAYAFIPSGIISTSTPTSNRTKVQQSLYDYGNEAGSYVQSFEEQHATEAQVLKDEAEDRANPEKIAAVEQIARDLRGVGQSLAGIETVPDAASDSHTNLAESYLDIGTKLSAVAHAQNGKDFLSAINTYNAAADIFTKNYIAMVELFGEFGVKFSSEDPGSVFTFTQVSL